ncbi:hypothetical protein MHI32_01415 [Paenibacillus sp. FSL H7-0690]|uniref:hypothetical protein n=1 Tax=Paenibacillus sp. FSL H7-0690 TaxID=2921437 RepID=UPI0030EB608D
MIRVSGDVKLRVPYVLDIDMTEDKWDALSEREQNEIIDGMIGHSEMESAELDDCDVWDVVEISNGES